MLGRPSPSFTKERHRAGSRFVRQCPALAAEPAAGLAKPRTRPAFRKHGHTSITTYQGGTTGGRHCRLGRQCLNRAVKPAHPLRKEHRGPCNRRCGVGSEIQTGESSKLSQNRWMSGAGIGTSFSPIGAVHMKDRLSVGCPAKIRTGLPHVATPSSKRLRQPPSKSSRERGYGAPFRGNGRILWQY